MVHFPDTCYVFSGRLSAVYFTRIYKKQKVTHLFTQVNLFVLLLLVAIKAASKNKYLCKVDKSVTLVSMIYNKAMKAAEAMEKNKN